jgi:hypothetical protein
MSATCGIDATALRLIVRVDFLPRVAEAATLGWRSEPPCGSPDGLEMKVERFLLTACFRFFFRGRGELGQARDLLFEGLAGNRSRIYKSSVGPTM